MNYASMLATVCGSENVVSISSVEFYSLSFRRKRLVSHDAKKDFATLLTHDGSVIFDGERGDGTNDGCYEPTSAR
jgi:hypothetical protein